MERISILVVEDEKVIAESLRLTLKEMQYSVLDVVTCGEDALEFLSQVTPDIILMDINLPGELNGIRTAQHINSKFDIPIIYLTAHGDQATLHKALETLPSAYILKPFKDSELRIAIELACSKYQVEKKLRASENKFRTLHETMKQGVIFQDAEGRIISVNPAAERILGLTEVDLGITTYELFSNSMRANGRILEKDEFPSVVALKTGIPINDFIIGIINKKTNELKWLRIDARPLTRVEDQKPSQVYTLFEDITEQMQQEKMLVQAKENAEKSDRLKTEFLAQMSHEIRTPINNILTFINLLREEFEDKLPEELQSSFTILDSSSKRLIRTIELILNMSKIQTGNFETNFEKIDLVKDILDDIVIEFYSRAHEKGLEFIVDKSALKTEIIGDKYSVGQIFVNLVGNALKYTENGYIKIIVSNRDENLFVSIEDTGKGISEEYLPHLFQPFTQEDSGYTRRFEGTGLGLSLVKKYTEINNALISVESQQGKGTTFCLEFKTA